MSLSDAIESNAKKVNLGYILTAICVVLFVLTLFHVFMIEKTNRDENQLRYQLVIQTSNGALAADNIQLAFELEKVIQKLTKYKNMNLDGCKDDINVCLLDLMSFAKVNPKTNISFELSQKFDIDSEKRADIDEPVEVAEREHLQKVIECLIIVNQMLLQNVCQTGKIDMTLLNRLVYKLENKYNHLKTPYLLEPNGDGENMYMRNNIYTGSTTGNIAGSTIRSSRNKKNYKMVSFEKDNDARYSEKKVAIPAARIKEVTSGRQKNRFIKNIEGMDDYHSMHQALNGNMDDLLGCVNGCHDIANYHRWQVSVENSIGKMIP